MSPENIDAPVETHFNDELFDVSQIWSQISEGKEMSVELRDRSSTLRLRYIKMYYQEVKQLIKSMLLFLPVT